MGRPKTGETKVRAIRVPDALWNQAQALAQARGESVSAVIRRGLAEYVESEGRRPAPRSRRRSAPGASDPAPRIAAQEPREGP